MSVTRRPNPFCLASQWMTRRPLAAGLTVETNLSVSLILGVLGILGDLGCNAAARPVRGGQELCIALGGGSEDAFVVLDLAAGDFLNLPDHLAVGDQAVDRLLDDSEDEGFLLIGHLSLLSIGLGQHRVITQRVCYRKRPEAIGSEKYRQNGANCGSRE